MKQIKKYRKRFINKCRKSAHIESEEDNRVTEQDSIVQTRQDQTRL